MKRVVERCLAETMRPPEGPIDLALMVPKTTDEAVYFIGKLRGRLLPTSKVWVVIPKLDSPMQAEFDGTAQDLTLAISRIGFIESGAVALSGDHTSIGFSVST